jgi:formamidopyrimidine-DNA glycosylase
MPEIPDLTVYIECLKKRTLGHPLQKIRLVSPFLLRTYDPKVSSIEGQKLAGITRIGKQIVLKMENDDFLIFHLMIAGRLHWKKYGAEIPRRIGLAAFDFSPGTLLLTEAGTKKRASLHIVRGATALEKFDKGGIEVFETGEKRFQEALTRENHTLKRALTDPRIIAGIGNTYSDEILHRARLSPLKNTSRLTEDEVRRLFSACRETLREWIERIGNDVGKGFPEKVTAFREGMAVHGRYGKPCPRCRTAVQRIVYAENECNYCPACQTGGRILADRALSRLLKNEWPRSLSKLEELESKHNGETDSVQIKNKEG